MHLRQGEVIVKVIRRHLTPYLLRLILISIIATPFYVILLNLLPVVEGESVLLVFLVLSGFIGVVVMVYSLDYLMDKLVITSKRVIWVNWLSLIKKEEREAELMDIQDVETQEKGILANLSFFDYGLLKVETSASKVTITFQDCPDPINVKNFLFSSIDKLRMQLRGGPRA